MLELRRVLLRAAGAFAAIVAVMPTAAAYAGSQAEKIRAHPASVMINTDTTLTGSGFPAHTTIVLEECGATRWLDPKVPCNTENRETVETNAKGRFTASFEVELCPEGAPGRHPTTRICYIGVPKLLEDTGKLEPAAKVQVSYP